MNKQMSSGTVVAAIAGFLVLALGLGWYFFGRTSPVKESSANLAPNKPNSDGSVKGASGSTMSHSGADAQ